MKYKKILIAGIVLSVLFFLIGWGGSPSKKEQVKAAELEMLRPLQLMGWRGSEIIIAPVKGTLPTDWSRMVITKDNQEITFQGLDSTDYITMDGSGRVFKPYQNIPISKSLAEGTFRLQATGNKPVKVAVTWRTK